MLIHKLIGGSYRAGAARKESEEETERLGAISEVRIVMGAGVGEPKEINLGKFPSDPKENESLKEDAEAITAKINSLLPKLRLPRVER